MTAEGETAAPTPTTAPAPAPEPVRVDLPDSVRAYIDDRVKWVHDDIVHGIEDLLKQFQSALAKQTDVKGDLANLGTMATAMATENPMVKESIARLRYITDVVVATARKVGAIPAESKPPA